MLDRRKETILKATIHNYISSAQPVGSRTIARKYNLGVSSATIRNEMADLEELGYLTQPHTSAGRIPSERGYRYFVDFLMKMDDLSEKQRQAVRQTYSERLGGIENVLDQTARLLSQLTDYTGVVLAPQLAASSILHINIVEVEPAAALIIVVTDTGMVAHRSVAVPEAVSSFDLNRIQNFLNSKLKGKTVADVGDSLFREMRRELPAYLGVLEDAVTIIEEVLALESEKHVSLGGTKQILKQPEFHDINRVQALLSFLEEDDRLCEVLLSISEDPTEIVIKIGSEHSVEAIADCSLVTATYRVKGRPVGTIGVIGPTRMRYWNVVSTIGFIKQQLGSLLSEMI